MPTIHTAAFDAYVEPARARSEIWRTLLGFVLFAVVFILVAGGLSAAIVFIGEAITMGMGFRLAFELNAGSSRFATFAALGLISMMIPALWLVVRFLHKRPFRSLLGPTGRIDWRMWRIAASVVLVAAAISLGTSFLSVDTTQRMPLQDWAPWAALALVFIFLQTTAEELVFRGYLQQQLAARFQSRWIWMVLPSVTFGALHWDYATYGDNTWLVVTSTAVVGLIASDLTARLGNLSAAMGLHFANNTMAMLFLTDDGGPLSGLGLWSFQMDAKSPEIGVEIGISIALSLAIYAIFVLIHRRRR